MPVSKEFSSAVVPDELKGTYVPPEAESLPTEKIDRATLCACKAGEDNPY